MGRYFAGRDFTFAQLVEDLATRRVGEGPENCVIYGDICIFSNLAI
jgi:hypothetical protein